MWEGDKLNKYGFTEDENINGLFRFSGGINCDMHPSKITVSDGAIDFAYGSAVRSFSLERSGGKITAFTNPDGTRTEVVHGE